MSLFSLDNILLNESTDGTSSPADMINFDHMQCLDDSIKNFSFVQEGYNFILDMRQNYIDAEKTFYENVLGSYGDDEIITESFSGFFDKIKEIINKFIEWIKKIFKQFVLKMNSLFSNEKYIKKHHKLLSKFGYNDEFEFKGYEFTYIEDSTMPAANALSAFTSTTQGKGYFDTWYDNGSENLNDTSDSDGSLRTAQTTKLNTTLDTKLTELQDNLEDFYDEFRGRVINKSNEKFDSSEFPEELFRVFRNNDNEPSNITIDSSFVTEAYRRFDKYKDTVKAIEKTQKEMIKDYEALEKYLDKLVKLNKADKKMTLGIYDAMPNTFGAAQIGTMITSNSVSSMNGKTIYDSSTFDKLNNYMKVQSAKVNEMCTIHTQAFTAKLEAAKDCFKQDKKILYKALNKIVGRSNKDNY